MPFNGGVRAFVNAVGTSPLFVNAVGTSPLFVNAV
jgi:hypothetical protein